MGNVTIYHDGSFDFWITDKSSYSVGDFVYLKSDKLKLYFLGQIWDIKEYNGNKYPEGKILAEFVKNSPVDINIDFKNKLLVNIEDGEVFHYLDDNYKDVTFRFTESYFNLLKGETSIQVGTLGGFKDPIIMNLLPKGLNRNLGLFGQSGSGKSYALGLIIEELHLKTPFDIVILDPNGDFCNFNRPLLDIEDFTRPDWTKIKERIVAMCEEMIKTETIFENVKEEYIFILETFKKLLDLEIEIISLIPPVKQAYDLKKIGIFIDKLDELISCLKLNQNLPTDLIDLAGTLLEFSFYPPDFKGSDILIIKSAKVKKKLDKFLEYVIEILVIIKSRELTTAPNARNPFKYYTETLKKYYPIHKDSIRDISICSNDVEGANQISISLSDLTLKDQAMVLQLDPIKDRDEYQTFSKIIKDLGPPFYIEDLKNKVQNIGALKTRILTRNKMQNIRKLRTRIVNLDLEDLEIWVKGDSRQLTEILMGGAYKTIVIDLSDLNSLEKSIVSIVVLDSLWRKQKTELLNKATLLVIDEAHHLFPSESVNPSQKRLLDLGVQIAGEGRKLGLYLLLGSQLPSKIHEHVLTQCGNLILMKMTSQSNIKKLLDSFGFVSERFLQKSVFFDQGDALIIGKITPAPCKVHFEGRKTQEGGKDFSLDLDSGNIPWNRK